MTNIFDNYNNQYMAYQSKKKKIKILICAIYVLY